MITIQHIIREVKKLRVEVDELKAARVVPEPVQVYPIPQETITIPDAPMSIEGPRRGRPRKVVE